MTHTDHPPTRATGAVRRLTAVAASVLLLAVGTVVGGGAWQPAAAADPTDVFVGVIDQATTTSTGSGSAQTPQAGRTVTFDVTVLSVYLGEISTESVQVTSTPAFFACPTRRVTLGQQYAFRVVSSGDSLVASACGNVRTATASVRRALARDYPDVRPPVPTGPVFDDVAFSSTDLSPPTEFTRAAAPGAALVIVGLLGLLVARRFARRG